ncbi:hypothetical protein [Streptomyces sp. NPDC058412]|uniref:hypothetical protein n=1 Tax=Streptomyces sp. NPDC058412 TaxID=3346486 RepID=UPI003646BBB3
MLSRPVSREQWLHKGRVYATGWAFADTGEPLVRSIDNTAAAHNRRQALMRVGFWLT